MSAYLAPKDISHAPDPTASSVSQGVKKVYVYFCYMDVQEQIKNMNSIIEFIFGCQRPERTEPDIAEDAPL